MKCPPSAPHVGRKNDLDDEDEEAEEAVEDREHVLGGDVHCRLGQHEKTEKPREAEQDRREQREANALLPRLMVLRRPLHRALSRDEDDVDNDEEVDDEEDADWNKHGDDKLGTLETTPKKEKQAEENEVFCEQFQ